MIDSPRMMPVSVAMEMQAEMRNQLDTQRLLCKHYSTLAERLAKEKLVTERRYLRQFVFTEHIDDSP